MSIELAMKILMYKIPKITSKKFSPRQFPQRIFIDGIFVIAVNSTRPSIRETEEFGKSIEEEISLGHTKLVVDLSKCEIIDSIFFGAVIIALKRITNLGGKLNLVVPVNLKEDIFTIANTLRLFNKYKTREDAVKNLSDL